MQDLSGNANSMIPLMLSAEPGDAGQDLILKLSGLPADAYLTAGTRDGDGWELVTKGSNAHAFGNSQQTESLVRTENLRVDASSNSGAWIAHDSFLYLMELIRRRYGKPVLGRAEPSHTERPDESESSHC